MPNEEPGPCFIVIGIVIIVFDIIIIESTYLIYFGGLFIFLGIIAAITTAKKTQKATTTEVVYHQEEQQIVQISPQNVQVLKEPPAVHKFCPHCGKNTTSEICSECGKKIDWFYSSILSKNADGVLYKFLLVLFLLFQKIQARFLLL